MSEWSRSRDGGTIHRSDCRYARIEWKYADGKTEDEVRSYPMSAPWLRLCGHCLPLRTMTSIDGSTP